MTAQPNWQTEQSVASASPLSKEDLEAGKLFVATGPMGVVLTYGRLIAYPEEVRQQVLMMPLDEYVRLGYVDPAKKHLLENLGNYDLLTRPDVHVHVTDAFGQSLYNVNFVNKIPLPTEELFDMDAAMIGAYGNAQAYINSHRDIIAEPSRLVGINNRDYALAYKAAGHNGFNPLHIYSMARSMLALGIEYATHSMGVRTYLFNFDSRNAGAFVANVAGHQLDTMSGVVVRPEVANGPFAPYFANHGPENPVFVTLTDALEIADRMGASARQALQLYSQKQS